MNCMRCGREIPNGRVFCEECLQDMERHPVPPGTPVTLPTRQESAAPRRHPKKLRKPEEQNHLLKNAVMWLCILLSVTLLALFLTVSILVAIMDRTPDQTLPGQNYNTTGPAQSGTAE